MIKQPEILPEILEFCKNNRDITYVISSEVAKIKLATTTRFALKEWCKENGLKFNYDEHLLEYQFRLQ